MQLGEAERTVGGVQVGEDAGGSDGAELPVVPDQAHPATPLKGQALELPQNRGGISYKE